ncbi:cell division control protein 15, cdc15 [Phyllosticta citrichinensis]|uniref:non-specific serine/threonine protein kinase n=1 Tax=Phyllosticta citrichinensis TaxID=1130410 RepID=A0ABR1Y4B2_9PEZI
MVVHPPNHHGNEKRAAAAARRPQSPAAHEKERQKPPSKDGRAQKAASEVAGLKDYQLGDCLGKGAFGSVYRALNWNNGETVAIKQVKLTDVPKNELSVIMTEIDLLKKLNHPNIVKYHGFVKDNQSLYIILEYCENGSLHSICKDFGKFPENLVAIYMSQVLSGLLYLHEQGVIHRDIKGANILTTKEGLVKLADFGVATKTADLSESSVVGTPYWMAPEVIELCGPTTASDIWSLGCTVIELLEGKPPYHQLQPMPALFRIVNDDHPPLPEAASPAVRDFLMQCFQKDPNLRVSARKLLKHPWIVNARRVDSVVETRPTKYDEAVKSVQEWNEALKSPTHDTLRRVASKPLSSSPVPPRKEPPPKITAPAPPQPGGLRVEKTRTVTDFYASPEDDQSDDWDKDFPAPISPSALRAPHMRPHDYFAGQLSSDKLKAMASTNCDTVTEEPSSEDLFEQAMARGSIFDQSDPLETIRPSSASKQKQDRERTDRPSRQRMGTEPKTQFYRPFSKGTTGLNANHGLGGPAKSPMAYRENSIEDYSDLMPSDDAAFQRKLQSLKDRNHNEYTPRLFQMSDLTNPPLAAQGAKKADSLRQKPGNKPNQGDPSKRPTSRVEIEKYAEHEEEDFDDVFGNDGVTPASLRTKQDSDSGSERGTLGRINSKLSGSWLGDDEDEDDPFAQLEEDFDEMDQEKNVARDRHARLISIVSDMVSSLKSQPEDVPFISDHMLQILLESPEMKNTIISSHGMLPMLEILESTPSRDVIQNLLKIVNIIILDNVEIQENLCFIGGIPIITRFAHRKFSSEIRQEAAAFVRQMYQTSTLTLQMFVGCGGLKVLAEFLEEDLEDERDFVLIGVNGIWSVFNNLQGPTPKNDFCRIFSRSSGYSVLYPLSLVLSKVLEERGEVAELIQERIVGIFMLFSQAENHVKEIVAHRMVLKRVLKDLQRMKAHNQITMLKFIKNLSMLASTHDSLQNSNAIEVLTDLLSLSMDRDHFREVSNQILNILYNLCRMSKSRQEDAALNGIEFALPILCDMAHSGKLGRSHLWQHKGLQFYITRVEEALIDNHFPRAMISCFNNQEASLDAFESLLEPLQRMLRVSPPVAEKLAHPELFSRTAQKLHTKKPVVRLNLLRIIRSICDSTEETGGVAPLMKQCGLYDSVKHLAGSDPAILVREMANDLLKACENPTMLSPSTRRSAEYNRSRPSSVRRQSVTFNTHGLPNPMHGGMVLPSPTPPIGSELRRQGSFWDGTESPRNVMLLGPSHSFDSGLISSGLLPSRPSSARSNSSRPLSRQGSGDSFGVFAVPYRPRTRDGSGDSSSSSYMRPRTRDGSGSSDYRLNSHARDGSDFHKRPHTRDGSTSSVSTAVSSSSQSRDYLNIYSKASAFVQEPSSLWYEESGSMGSSTPTAIPESPDESHQRPYSSKASRLPVNVRPPSSRRANVSQHPNGIVSSGTDSVGSERNSALFAVGTPPRESTHLANLSSPVAAAATPSAGTSRAPQQPSTPQHQHNPPSSQQGGPLTPHTGQRLAVRRRRQTSSGFTRRGSKQEDLAREIGHANVFARRGSKQAEMTGADGGTGGGILGRRGSRQAEQLAGGSSADGSWGTGSGASGVLARRGSRQAEQLGGSGVTTSWKDRGIGKDREREREREKDRSTVAADDKGGGGG